jgi:hypothetical protein
VKRIVYRGGLKYKKTGLVVDGESINDVGFTLGYGLPITETLSNVNIGLELGKELHRRTWFRRMQILV